MKQNGEKENAKTLHVAFQQYKLPPTAYYSSLNFKLDSWIALLKVSQWNGNSPLFLPVTKLDWLKLTIPRKQIYDRWR